MLCTLPVEVVELIFSAVVWDDFVPECVERLNKASECIARIHERNRTLRALRLIGKFVDPILWRLSFKYVHITSHSRALELLSATGDCRLPGELVRHLFVGDRLGRYHVENAPSYTWVTSESGRYWVEWRILAGLLTLVCQLKSLHIHLPGIHSQIFSSSFIQSGTISSPALQTITCLSLYDDVNNSHCYQPVRFLREARASLSGFVKLQDLIISESEGITTLDRLTAFPSDQQPPKHNLPGMKRIILEKWCPMGHDIILYNLVMEIPLSDLRVLRKVPRRMSMDGRIWILPTLTSDMNTIIAKVGPNLTSLRLDFAYHFADDLNPENLHLCTAIRDNCQSLEYLTLCFPPSDKIDDAPRASVCHQLFRAPGNFKSKGIGMLNLKRAEIIGHHTYCAGSSREMVINASEDVWASQNVMVWESCLDGSMDHECLHTNIQIHGR